MQTLCKRHLLELQSHVRDCYVFFFFSSRRRHTRLQGDWSSDVCSSDLCCSRPSWPSWCLRCASCPRPFFNRKSTRLNSSHLVISYAVFCLKKKKKNTPSTGPSSNLTTVTSRQLIRMFSCSRLLLLTTCA